jgi:hypothetical protein
MVAARQATESASPAIKRASIIILVPLVPKRSTSHDRRRASGANPRKATNPPVRQRETAGGGASRCRFSPRCGRKDTASGGDYGGGGIVEW